MVILVKLLQPSNTGLEPDPIVVQFSALKTTEVSAVQFLNAPPPINTTEFGIVTDVSLSQP